MIYKRKTLKAEPPRPILKQKQKRVEIAQHRVCDDVLMQIYFSLQCVDSNN